MTPARHDVQVLASACRRAGKPANAAQLMFNRGVLYDNMGDASAALRCYKDLLRASLETGDVVGEALACNCIGVTLQMQGPTKLSEALKYHQQHLAVADVPGKFIAHSNLGLAFQVTEPPVLRNSWEGGLCQQVWGQGQSGLRAGGGRRNAIRHPTLNAAGAWRHGGGCDQPPAGAALRHSHELVGGVRGPHCSAPALGATCAFAARPAPCCRCPSGDADRSHARTQGEPGVRPPRHGQPRGRRRRSQGLHGAAAAARAHSARSTRQRRASTATTSPLPPIHPSPPSPSPHFLTGLALEPPNSHRGVVAGDAFLQLGSLAHSSGEWNEAQHYFEQALRVAETHADRESSDLARCNVGLTQGNMEFESFLSQVGNQ